MAKIISRCSLCGKFATFADMQDDELCWRCGDRLQKEAEKRTVLLSRYITGMAVVIIILGVLLIDAWTAKAQNVEYYVTGVNTATNERVVGWLDGQVGSGEVQGTVLDRGDRFVVVGVANGKGSFELRSLCCKYDVVVADEVSASKLQNRKLGRKNNDYIKFGK